MIAHEGRLGQRLCCLLPGEILGDAIEGYAGQQGEARRSAVAIQQLVGYYESGGSYQKTASGDLGSSGLKSFLKQVEGERGDERAAGEGQCDGNQPLGRTPEGPGNRADHQSTGRRETDEEGR
jgi:hypothetical protein